MRLQYSSKNHGILVALIFTFNALRNTGPFRFPSFWAEDATFFFKDSIELGIQSIWTPIIGHYHTIPRLIAWAATWFHPKFAPLFYATGAGLVASLCFSLFYRPALRWIIDKDSHRFYAALIFSMAPGAHETFFALCTLNYLVFIGIVLIILGRREFTPAAKPTPRSDSSAKLGIQKPSNQRPSNELSSTQKPFTQRAPTQSDLTWPKAILLTFLWFSAGQSLAVLPLLILLAILERRAVVWALAATLLLSVALNLRDVSQHQASFPVHLESTSRFFQLVGVWYDALTARFLVLPVFGEGLLMTAVKLPDFIYHGLILAIGVCAYLALRRLRPFSGPESAILICLTLCAGGLFVLIGLVRVPPEHLMRPNFDLRSRYTLVPSMVALMIFFGLISKLQFKRYSGFFKALLVVLATNNICTEGLVLKASRFEPFTEIWPTKSEEIAQALRDRQSGKLQQTTEIRDIPARPPGWGRIEVLRVQN